MNCASSALNDLDRLQVDQSNSQNVRVRLNVIGLSPLARGALSVQLALSLDLNATVYVSGESS
jgi:hypothetical protein